MTIRVFHCRFIVYNMRQKRIALQMPFFLFVFFLYPSSATPNSSFFGDANVLISMKAAMVGNNNALHSWRASDNNTHCLWTGVQCDRLGRVVYLHLSNSKLSGQFPGDVTNLPALRLLDVSSNILNGSLPSYIISKLMDVSDKLTILYQVLCHWI